jgi:ribosomal-protein-alanine N-acetyltransferase
VTVRAARRGDLPAVLAIESASFATDRISPRNFRRMLARGNCAILVAERRGAVAGYGLVLFRRGASRARLYRLAVDPARRRAGVARDLLRAIESLVAARGLTALTLEAGVTNSAAARLYEEMGYRQVASLGPYYADGSSANRWTKSVARVAR